MLEEKFNESKSTFFYLAQSEDMVLMISFSTLERDSSLANGLDISGIMALLHIVRAGFRQLTSIAGKTGRCVRCFASTHSCANQAEGKGQTFERC